MLGIRDDRVCKRLLRLNDLSLKQVVDIFKSSEQTQQQVKQMSVEDVSHTPYAAKDSFHQILLDDASSYLTMFNKLFGRYQWTRMPFSISCAREVWQQHMHEFVEDLDGVEVIAGNFLIAGFRNTDAEVNSSLEKNERVFFSRNVGHGTSS